MELKIISSSEKKTQELAFHLGLLLFQGSVVALNGPLGAGKTQFGKGIALSLNVKEEISSPTFNILKCYFSGNLPFYHIDAYRLEDGTNIDIGLEEVIEGDGVCIIEWPSFLSLDVDHIDVDIKIISENEREITISSNALKYENVLNTLKEQL